MLDHSCALRTRLRTRLKYGALIDSTTEQVIQRPTNENQRSLKSDLRPNTEDLFIKSTLCFERDLNRLGLDEPMTLAFEQHLLNMSSLCFHNLLYRLRLLWWHYLVFCSLQELYSFESTHGVNVYVEA
jgi:hypothetical protein